MTVHNSHIMVDGQFVSAKAERIVLAIKEYERTIEVKWIPPGNRSPGEAAYAIIHNEPGNKPYVMFYVQNDEDFDERVLQRIIYNDQRKTGKQQYSELEAWEASQKLVQEQEFLDALEEMHDVAAHIIRTPLNTYKVNDNLVIKDGIPFNAAKLRD